MSENTFKKIERNDDGLVVGLPYKTKEDGTLDWKSVVPSKYIYVNPDFKRREKIEAKYGKKYDEIDPSIDNVEDTDLVIMLGGIKYLLKIRGYENLTYNVIDSGEQYASVNCSISFIPNVETENRKITFADNGSAHIGSTTDFGQKYLLEVATNRAFCRCVRNFLNIDVVSKEELGKDSIEEVTPKNTFNLTKQSKLLETLMSKKGIKWEHIADKLKKEDEKALAELKEGQEKPNPRWNDTYKSVSDLPPNIILELIERIKKIPSPAS